MKLPLHILPVLFLLAFAERVNAQGDGIAIPAWMQPYFAEGSTTTLPAGDRGPVKHNSSSGSYTARMTIHDTLDGITQMLYLSAWQDSTRGTMQQEAEVQNDHQHLKMRALELKPGVVDPKMFEITKGSWKP